MEKITNSARNDRLCHYHVLSRESRNCGKNERRIVCKKTDRTFTESSGLLGVEPKIVECPNIMSISLGNPGQVIHPGVQLGHAAMIPSL